LSEICVFEISELINGKLINDHQGERSSWGPGATRSGGHPPLLAGRFDDQFRKILIFSKK
jgi:hypothetical protein